MLNNLIKNQRKAKRRSGPLSKYVRAVMFLIITSFSGFKCAKIVDVDPPTTGLSSENVFINDINAASAVTGVYQSMMLSPNEFSGGNKGISLKLGLASDEFKPYYVDNDLSEVYMNKVSINNAINYTSWSFYYKYIYQCNSVIRNLELSTKVTQLIKSQLIGEAKFMRALLYFYLNNLYGDVPLILSTDYKENSISKRTNVEEVNKQILSDLQSAVELLPDGYQNSSGQQTEDRLRPNRGAAIALLARVYLYHQEWQKAEDAASKLIGGEQYQLVDDLLKVFNRDSKEAILQFQTSAAYFCAYDGYSFILDDNFNSNSPVALTENLLESFNSEDLRFKSWIGVFNNFYFPYKYKIKGGSAGISVDEYCMVLRVAEQYLIRAEARAELGDLMNSVSDLNAIRRRAGIQELANNMSKGALLDTIMKERQREFFTEWGHRWLDLKRTERLDSVMNTVATVKMSSWSPMASLFPIPSAEIIKNQHLTQNPGY